MPATNNFTTEFQPCFTGNPNHLKLLPHLKKFLARQRQWIFSAKSLNLKSVNLCVQDPQDLLAAGGTIVRATMASLIGMKAMLKWLKQLNNASPVTMLLGPWWLIHMDLSKAVVLVES